MHPNRGFRWTDQEAMLAMVDAIAFTRVFAQVAGVPRVAHVPVLVTPDKHLRFHLANANPLTPALHGMTALALVEGPNAYLSANWYIDVSGAVPTWNYVAVEAVGTVTRLDRNALVTLVDALAEKLEPRVGENWTRAKMDAARFEAMLGGITAFEMHIDELRGTRKLSQNKPDDEAAAVIAGMRAAGAFDMVAAIEQARP